MSATRATRPASSPGPKSDRKSTRLNSSHSLRSTLPIWASDLIGLTADSKDWGEGVKLAYVRDARHAACQFTGTKILSWAMNLTWLESAQARGFDEVILLNERGEIAECTSANLFIANGSHVYTPPLSSGCLPGITREVILREIRVRPPAVPSARRSEGERRARACPHRASPNIPERRRPVRRWPAPRACRRRPAGATSGPFPAC